MDSKVSQGATDKIRGDGAARVIIVHKEGYVDKVLDILLRNKASVIHYGQG